MESCGCFLSPFLHRRLALDSDIFRWAGSWSSGQVCMAGSRIFVQSGIYDEFLKRFTEKTRSLKLGDPFDPDAYQGPVVSKEHYDVLLFFHSNFHSPFSY